MMVKILLCFLLVSFAYTCMAQVKESQTNRYISDTPTLNDLGENYSREYTLGKSKKARLAVVNESLMQELGLDFKKIQKLFGIEMWLKRGKAKGRATYYSYGEAGNLSGDGRLVWVGEYVKKDQQGRYHYYDITVKGVGRNDLSQGQSGRLSLDEALNSFVISTRAQQQGLDVPQDLAIFLLDQADGDGKPTSLSVRVGNQFRIASLGPHYNEPEKLQKILDIIVKRNLGLAPEVKIGPQERREYVVRFIERYARETARANELLIEHGMLHTSNITSDGKLIDFGTSRQRYIGSPKEVYTPRALVNVFAVFTGIAPPSMKYIEQHGDQSKEQVVEGYIKRFSNPETHQLSSEYFGRRYHIGDLLNHYDRIYKIEQAHITLKRIGLSARDIVKLGERKLQLYANDYQEFSKQFERWDNHLVFKKLAQTFISNQELTKELLIDIADSTPFNYANPRRSFFLQGVVHQNTLILNRFVKTLNLVFNTFEQKEIKAFIPRAKTIFPKRRAAPTDYIYEDPFLDRKLRSLRSRISKGEIDLSKDSLIMKDIVDKTRHRLIDNCDLNLLK